MFGSQFGSMHNSADPFMDAYIDFQNRIAHKIYTPILYLAYDNRITLANYYTFVMKHKSDPIPILFLLSTAQIANNITYIEALNPLTLTLGIINNFVLLGRIEPLVENYRAHIIALIAKDNKLQKKIDVTTTLAQDDTYLSTVVKDVVDLVITHLQNSLFMG